MMTKIENEQAYQAALDRIEELIPLVDESTPYNDKNLIELDLLSGLVSDYEDIHYPISAPSLADVIKLRMEEMSLSIDSLANLLGTDTLWLNRFLKGETEPTFSIARIMSKKLNIDGNIVLGTC